jgi:hypothetical protein
MKGAVMMRWKRLVGATLALGFVACGGSNQTGNSATGGASAANQTGGTSSVETGGSGAGGATSGGTSSGPVPSTFSCSNLGPLAADASAQICIDFSSSSDAAKFTPDVGADAGTNNATWAIVNGAYVGTKPSGSGDVTCVGAGSLFTASNLSNFSAADVRVRVKMTSLTRVDKVLVLRERDSGDRFELNFRANYVENGQTTGGDLVIQELIGCQDTTHVDTGVVLIPHSLLQTLAVLVELRGQQFKVTVDGNVVYNMALPVAIAAGSVGFALIDSAEMFDDLIVETLK